MDDDDLEIAPGVRVPLTELELRTSRSSGPGGQHANVTASRVEAIFDVERSQALPEPARERLLERLGPRVSAVAQDERSQLRNRALAIERLRERLAAALHVDPPRRPTRPSRAARERRAQAKRSQSQLKRSRRPPDGD
ncbi:MAG: alternative ribosome rescue aminoacyl-tRNA hydrolase ArfB [Solirubrobacteraceae bacterium]|jgi:ribosome-associated protein